MKTGVAYMGHHNPKHLKTDLQEMQAMNLDDVLLCLQENDFVHFNGKLNFTPTIAKDHGVRPIAIFWGALNLFGGGRSSQFLLENPAGFQVGRNGEHRPQGCYVNDLCLRRIKEMIDLVAERGYEGYFVDEPTPLDDCFCSACKSQYETWYGGNLLTATAEQQAAFRQRCVIDYIAKISDYCKANHPALETMCCLMLSDKDMWTAAAQILSLDNLGTDIYWVNYDYDVEEMAPHVQEMAAMCRDNGKVHHEWLECWRAKAGREGRIFDMGEVLVRQKPDSLYVWAWEGQIGTRESCENPAAAWAQAKRIFEIAKAR